MKVLVLFILASCTSLFYHPDRVLYVKPDEYNFTYKELTFHSSDKTELIGWFFPAKTKNPKGTIIQFHGNAQNMSAHFLGLSWVMDKGYNLFVWDYRGYGISDGRPSPKGIYQDSLSAMDEGRKLWAENGKGKFIVYGQSLGGPIAMKALDHYKEKDFVDLVVQDCTYMSYQDIAFHKLSRSILFPLSPLAYVLVTDKYSSEEAVKNMDRPTLVIVGGKDRVVDQKFGRKIFKTLRTTHKWLWKNPEGEHITTFHDPKSPLRDKFIQLLDSLPEESN